VVLAALWLRFEGIHNRRASPFPSPACNPVLHTPLYPTQGWDPSSVVCHKGEPLPHYLHVSPLPALLYKSHYLHPKATTLRCGLDLVSPIVA